MEPTKQLFALVLYMCWSILYISPNQILYSEKKLSYNGHYYTIGGLLNSLIQNIG